jgi:acetyl esterase/lipase
MKYFFLFIMIGVVLPMSAQPIKMDLWPEGVPNTLINEIEEGVRENNGVVTHVYDVSNPTLTIYKAEVEDGAKSPAVVICPGGGYVNLSIEKEGHDVAKFLAKNGITGVVLKYRLPNDEMQKNKTIAPLQDARKAISTIKNMAVELNIFPGMIGVMGFSAGGHLAATASTHFDTDNYSLKEIRPDFSVLIYPVASMKPGVTHMGSHDRLLGEDPDEAIEIQYSNELQINKNTPPTFMVHSFDDGSVPIANSLRYVERLSELGIECETHFYKSGGHGYGMLPGHTDTWPGLLVKWIKTLY